MRGIDARKHLFYIVTPLSLRELSQVNTLLRGALEVPDWLLMNQVSGNIGLMIITRVEMFYLYLVM